MRRFKLHSLIERQCCSKSREELHCSIQIKNFTRKKIIRVHESTFTINVIQQAHKEK